MTADANPLTAGATGRIETPPPTPVVQFRAWVDAFERLGYDVDSLLADISLTRSDLADPDLLIPCDVVGAFFRRSQQVRPLKNLWTRLGAVTPLGAIPLLDYLILTSDTVGQGFEQEARYFRLLNAPFTLDIQRKEDPVRVVYLVAAWIPPSTVEYSAILNVQGFRTETDDRFHFAYVSFTHQPDDAAEIERLLGCDVRVNASWAGFAMPRKAWDLPLRRRDPILRAMLESQADAIIAARMPPLNGLALDVRRVLMARLARGESDIELVARDLAMSARTLQRKLAAAGLSYHELLDRARHETAERCLADSSLSIGEVAYLTGYSEPAAFHRAFRRWTGITPQAFRERRRSGVRPDTRPSPP
jgi:AraC-like DNA-binding protein